MLRRNLFMAARNSKRQYLLRGLVRCTICGKSYIGSSSISTGHAYYRCSGSTSFRAHAEPKCPAKSVPAPLLEEIVWQDVKAFVCNPAPVLDLLEKRIREQTERARPLEVELDDIKKSLTRQQAEREKVISLYRKGFAPEDEAQKELLALGREMEALAQRREALFAQAEQGQRLEAKTINAQVLLERLRHKVEQADSNIKRELVEALVDQIRVETVKENGRTVPKITVTYCFAEQGTDLQCSMHESTRAEQSKFLQLDRVYLLRTTGQAAALFGASCSSLLRWIDDGKVPAVHTGKLHYVVEEFPSSGNM